MAVTNVTSFAAGAVISNSAARVSSIVAKVPTDGTTGNTFLMVYDKATAPTGGTDTPDVVNKITVPSQEGNRGTFKIVFPNGGKRFGTGVGLFVATTFNGATGATTTAPSSVDVFWEPA
jgi:hypothetical protein